MRFKPQFLAVALAAAFAAPAFGQGALVKIDEGTYGVCDRCGQPIPEGRLEALPWASTHVSCEPS